MSLKKIMGKSHLKKRTLKKNNFHKKITYYKPKSHLKKNKTSLSQNSVLEALSKYEGHTTWS